MIVKNKMLDRIPNSTVFLNHENRRNQNQFRTLQRNLALTEVAQGGNKTPDGKSNRMVSRGRGQASEVEVNPNKQNEPAMKAPAHS